MGCSRMAFFASRLVESRVYCLQLQQGFQEGSHYPSCLPRVGFHLVYFTNLPQTCSCGHAVDQSAAAVISTLTACHLHICCLLGFEKSDVFIPARR